MKRFLIPLACLLVQAFPGSALAAGELRLDLRQAEALWREHSRELRVAESALQGGIADLRSAGERPNPVVSVNSLSLSPQEGIGGGQLKNKNMDTQLRIEQLIERGGKRELRIKGAEARLAAARGDVENYRRSQRGELRAAFYDLKQAQERLLLSEESVAAYGQSLDAGRLRQKAGDLAAVDVARLRIDDSRARSELRQDQAALDAARRALAYLIGSDEAARLVAGGEWPAAGESAAEQLAAGDVVDKVLAARPDLQAARQRVLAAEADRDLALAARRRDVTVGVQYERNLQNLPTNSYGIGVSVPLFLWHNNEGAIARGEADYDTARLQYEQLQARLRSELEQLRQRLIAAHDRLRLYDEELLADARRTAQAAEFAYGKGAMSLMDLLDARRSLKQLQTEAAMARAEHAKALSDWRIATDTWETP